MVLKRILCAAMLVPFIAGAGAAEDVSLTTGVPGFETGQHWACGAEVAALENGAGIEFIVTGMSTKRQISTRDNFQTDEQIVSVALLDRRPEACRAAAVFSHLGFTEDALKSCSPVLKQSDGQATSGAGWNALKEARLAWLYGMSQNKGVVVGMPPSRFLKVMSAKRC